MSSEFDLALTEYLTEGKAINEEIARAIEELKRIANGRPIVLFGRVSPAGFSMIEILAEFELQPAVFCAIDGEGENVGEVPVVDFQALKNSYSDAVVIVCSSGGTSEAAENLAEMGFQPAHVFPWDWSSALILTQLDALASQSFRSHIAKYSWAYELFEDEISKQTVLDRLRLYLCRVPMQANTHCTQYFEEACITLGDREVFVDGGAHRGETVCAFIKAVEAAKLAYAHIYSFEPDSVNYQHAVENLSEFPNVTVVPKGMWNAETELPFFEKGNQISSFVIDMAMANLQNPENYRVPVTSLDAFFDGVPDSDLPTFIKMDLEGAEQEALLGASSIIGRAKPKLAISAYHKPEDLYRLPQIIMRMRGDYRFALRQHKEGRADTVLYAV
jgi:FkbM family methyltransferase